MDIEFLLKMLLDSVKRVDEKYYKRYDGSFLERPFCYELYHQFRLLQGDVCSLILSAEPSKTLSYKFCNGQYLDENTNKDRVFPDFVLHKGLDDNEPKNQIMAIEVKHKENLNKEKLENDVKKLKRYVSRNGGLCYDFGVFIAVGLIKTELEKLLKSIDDNVLGDSKNKIYFIATGSLEEGAFTK